MKPAQLAGPTRTQPSTRLRRWKGRISRHAKGILNAWRYSGELAGEQGLNRLGMLGEAAWLALRGRMGVDTYFHYRLFDPRLSAEAKRLFLAEAPKANARLWSLLAPDRYRCLYENKLVFNRFFTGLGLPLASIFGVLDPLVGRTAEGESLRDEIELGNLMSRLKHSGFVFKPVEGVKGHLVLILTGAAQDDPAKFVTLSGERYGPADLIAAARNTEALEVESPGANLLPFLLEEWIRPHPALAEFIGPTLCTVRVLTVVALDGSPRIVGSVFKLQPRPLGVDHLRYGGVGCWVDPDTGALGPGRTRTTYRYTSVIPGTDVSFVGYRLPLWAEVKSLALQAAAAFPWARAIGWDIAISNRGPVLIEGNDRWSPSLVQLPAPRGLMDGELREVYDALRGGG